MSTFLISNKIDFILKLSTYICYVPVSSLFFKLGYLKALFAAMALLSPGNSVIVAWKAAAITHVVMPQHVCYMPMLHVQRASAAILR